MSSAVVESRCHNGVFLAVMPAQRRRVVIVRSPQRRRCRGDASKCARLSDAVVPMRSKTDQTRHHAGARVSTGLGWIRHTSSSEAQRIWTWATAKTTEPPATAKTPASPTSTSFDISIASDDDDDDDDDDIGWVGRRATGRVHACCLAARRSCTPM
jgi:hypothetical protein